VQRAVNVEVNDGDWLFRHERAAAREGRAKTMHCVAETFQHRSLVARVFA
jgi:hypothetical protein